MNNEEIQKLSELIKSPIKDIKVNEANNFTEIIFENGQTIPLYGKPIEINYEIAYCSFCNASSIEKYLFTKGKETTNICSDCATEAVQTFLNNGVEINLDISNVFPELSEKIKNMNENS